MKKMVINGLKKIILKLKKELILLIIIEDIDNMNPNIYKIKDIIK